MRSSSEKIIGVLAALFLLTVPNLCSLNSFATSAPVLTSAPITNSNNLPVEIDKALFLSTVPSFPVLDQNYTVKILIKNNLNEPIPVIFAVVVPFTAAIIHPFTVHYTLGPNAQVIGNFTINVFNRLGGAPINVSATVWIWFTSTMNKPEMIQQISTEIYGATPSPYTDATILLVGAIVASVAIALIFVVRSAVITSRKDPTSPSSVSHHAKSSLREMS